MRVGPVERGRPLSRRRRRPAPLRRPARVAAATVVAKRMLPHARVIAASLRRHHPEIPFFALLADEVEGCFDPAAEPFTVVPLDALDVDEPAHLRFGYDQQPLSYALTPDIVRHLLERRFDAVLFVKQESLVLGDLSPLLEPLRGGASLVLTPHLLRPADVAGELTILLSGVFNGGVLGVGSTGPAYAFLAWWQDRLRRHCVLDVAHGFHYEQRWLDFAPGLFPGVHILRDPRVNIGHWNLEERAGVISDARLFRFSGYSPDEPGTLTRYYPERVATGVAAHLVEVFRRELDVAGWEEASRWPYAFERFDNGVPIPVLARELHRSLGEDARRFGDPFRTGPGSFYAWLDEPVAGTPVTRLWRAVLERRPDLRSVFPDAEGADLERFVAWTAEHGAREHGIPERLGIRSG